MTSTEEKGLLHIFETVSHIENSMREIGNHMSEFPDQEVIETLKQQRDIMEKLAGMFNHNIRPVLESRMPFTTSSITNCFNSISKLDNVVDEKRERINRLYAAKLKFCTRIYSNLNEKLSADLQTLKKQCADSQQQIHSFITSKDEINQMENRIKRYVNELAKLDKKYPWLTDAEMTLPNIMLEIKKLENVRQQHDDLQTEIGKFKGLKPDITQARQQLKMIKSEYERLSLQANKFR